MFVQNVVLTACVLGSTIGASERPPNIVLLIADDLGYGELSPDGSHAIPTPHLDRLIAGGTYCTHGYVTAPFCAASRAGLITGRYQTRFGFEFNPIGAVNDEPGVGLPQSELTLPEMLRDAGYVTGLVGKWHLGGSAPFHPLRHGFEEFFGFLHEGHFFVPPPYDGMTTMLRRRVLPPGANERWTSADGRLVLHDKMGHNEPPYDANNPVTRDGQPVVETDYLTRALTREAVSFIDRHAERPFFLMLAYNAVHSPLQAPNDVVDSFENIEDMQRRIFAAMYKELDDSVGKVLKTLDAQQLENDTLVVFLSDNGGPTRELTSSNLPCRGEKGQVFEGGLRVPFVVKWPGRIPAGKTSETPVIATDIFETSRVAADVTLKDRTPRDGVDLAGLLNDSNAEPRDLFWRVGNRRAIRRGPWKLVDQAPKGWGKKSPGWKLINLENDIEEATDVSIENQQTTTDLKAQWTEINKGMVERLW